MLQDDDAKGLCEAIGHWLEYQIACRRSELLSESYIAHPVGEYLRVHHRGRIQLEWKHPNLNPAGRRGRPRQVDYALFSPQTDRPVTALEAKWAEAPVDQQRLLNDLLRLECLRNVEAQVMTRFFLFAGTTSNVAAALAQEINVGGARQSFISHIMPLLDAWTRVEVARCEPAFQTFFRGFEEEYACVLPKAYRVRLVHDYSGGTARCLMWKVESHERRATFRPSALWAAPAAAEVPAPDAGAPAGGGAEPPPQPDGQPVDDVLPAPE